MRTCTHLPLKVKRIQIIGWKSLKENLFYRFTSVVRTGLVFNGTEKITVGGGEALWLYINKVLVVEIISTGTATCHKIDLSPAATSGPIILKIRLYYIKNSQKIRYV